MKHHEHSKRVAKMTEILCKKLGFNKGMIGEVSGAALYHDCAKCLVKAEILYKDSPLTEREIHKLRLHTTLGQRMLKELGFPKICQTVALQHHEWWNGTGYPHGLKEKEISLEAQLVAITDVYDTLREEKPNRKAYNHKEAVERMVSLFGRQFNPKLKPFFIAAEKQFSAVVTEDSAIASAA